MLQNTIPNSKTIKKPQALTRNQTPKTPTNPHYNPSQNANNNPSQNATLQSEGHLTLSLEYMQSELKLTDQLLYSTVTNITHFSNRDVSKGKQEEGL